MPANASRRAGSAFTGKIHLLLSGCSATRSSATLLGCGPGFYIYLGWRLGFLRLLFGRERRSMGKRPCHPLAKRALILHHRGRNDDVFFHWLSRRRLENRAAFGDELLAIVGR